MGVLAPVRNLQTTGLQFRRHRRLINGLNKRSLRNRMKALRLSFWTQDTNWLGQSQRLDGRAVIWGSGSGVRRGPDEFPLGHFRSRQFHRGQLRPGTHGNPAVAPSPETQGWTETTGTGTSVGGDPLQVHDV